MKKAYLCIIVVITLCMPILKASAQNTPYLVMGAIPKAPALHRSMGGISQAYLNYMKSDSVYFPLSYFTSYMFNMNSRYVIADTGFPMTNQLLLHSFSVLFDTLLDASHTVSVHDTGYALSIVSNITVDSINVIIGHCNHSGTRDTIIVQIDSVDAYGYITDSVKHSDTIYTATGLSPGNNWLNPINIVVRPSYPAGYLVDNARFAVTVKYYGSKQDTMGFLPGFPYSNCLAQGSGPIPKETRIGETFGTLRANSLTSGYQYFFGHADTIPTPSGMTNGLYIRCSNPNSRYWWFQDNPISAYVNFLNTTGINELVPDGFTIAQNYPNPFNQKTQITYSLVKVSAITLNVYDITGRQLVNTKFPLVSPGEHIITLDARQFTPGVYFYTFNVNGAMVTKKMVITQ